MSGIKLMMRMENEATAELADPSEALAVESNAAIDAKEVTEAAAQVTEMDTGVENAMEAQGEVSAAVDAMSEAVEEGDGLSPREAEAINARLERACRLLGADQMSAGLVLRRENFGGSQSRLAMTKMRLEAAQGFLARIWEAIKKGWEWLVDAVKNLWGKVTKSAKSLEERLKSLDQRLNNIGAGAKLNKENLSAAAKVFSIEGKTDKSTIETIVDQTNSFPSLLVELKEVAGALGKEEKSGEKVLSVLGATFKTRTGVKNAGEGATVGGYLPGGKAIAAYKKTVNVGDASLETVELSTIQADEKMAEDYKAFDIAALKDLTKKGLASVRGLIEYEKAKGQIDGLIKAQIDFANAVIKADGKAPVEGEDAKKAKAQMEERAALTRSAQGNIKFLTQTIPTAHFTIVSSLADLIAAGASNMKTEKKD